MKILMFNARPSEANDIQDFEKQNHVKIDTTDKSLTMDTVNMLKEYDGLSTHTIDKDPAIYEKLAQFGIKQIAIRHTGYEIVNLKAATKNHLVVTNVPGYSPRSVSELVLMHVIMLLRHFKKIVRREQQGNFLWAGTMSKELYNLTVGVIGAGKIGSEVARVFKALGCNVIANDPIHRNSLEAIVKYVPLKELLTNADIVTLHTPLLDSTHHLIDSDEFKLMKKSAFLINASRGAVVNTQALIDALKHKQIAAAGLDTIEGEDPLFDHKLSHMPTGNQFFNELQKMDNVNITPHIGFNTDVSNRNMVFTSLGDAIKGIKGEKVEDQVNK
ncbi:lactate dehydrogenase [Philodulcilactobacillus myokoensis]|uniref:Lactate dehydrogenase n=1 Tax=Philodulcilactobacillus myokoensis TaxID=2929573 RepID=A0A9W6ETK8_9LACO|nr:D-2-hydroxyacid dehydrogenase [Philodulcilactobacillus myokoensis]GLB47467.1 lactate dehydrogenase [Philodulcilactobacillus myokoensis]